MFPILSLGFKSYEGKRVGTWRAVKFVCKMGSVLKVMNSNPSKFSWSCGEGWT